MSNAPLYTDILEGPKDGCSEWLQTKDNVSIRVAFWINNQSKGTVIIFPGRNEYIEKYGRTCQKLLDMGYDTLVVDWRGQGLSDRLLKNPLIGHVDEFKDYQHDVNAIVKFADIKKLSKPWYLLAHSMGGAIGLRALHDGLNIEKVIFSAPMWDIKMSQKYLIDKIMHTYAHNSRIIYKALRMENNFAPGTDTIPYLETASFNGNSLTTDKDHFLYLKNQILKYPELGLAGPSIKWLRTALIECKNLQKLPPPQVPCLTFSSINDKIVNNTAIKKVMKKWQNGRHSQIENAEHEVLMEDSNLLKTVYSDIQDFLN